MEKEYKSPDDIKKLVDQIKDALSGISDQNILESNDAIEIFNELNKSDEFEQEIEQILACLNEQTMDLTKLQTQIILLIKKYLGKFPKKQLLHTINETVINKNVAEVSDFLMKEHSKLIRDANSGLINSKDKLQSLSAQSRTNLKRLIKNFAVYQIYKFMNPKRIAGETRKENFAYNMIVGGIEFAKHYAGGSKSEIASYSPNFIKKLEKAHVNFNKGGGRTL